MASEPERQSTVDSSAAFLGVERSLSGNCWRMAPQDERLTQAIAQVCDVPDLIARLLAGRGQNVETAPGFLHPRLRDSLPDPFDLRDMEIAAERISEAIRRQERIALFGDYDVDGATSAALMSRFFAAVGGPPPRLYVPDRMKEGYGPNAEAFRLLSEEGIKLVVTLDCGITAFDPIEAARSLSLDVIIVDHHVAEPSLPKALAIVNPNRLDETFPHRQLAAVGVAFLLAVAINRKLRLSGWYGQDRTEPDLMALLDLVALGTICDVASLTGVNRALVSQGLKIMAQRSNTGVRALAEIAGIEQRLDAYHAGYVLGPRVNAGGRIGRSDLGALLLSTDDPALALDYARLLDSYNAERRVIESSIMEQAMDMAATQMAAKPPLLFLAGENWHQGIIGIVAGRVKEKYQRPVCVLSIEGDLAKASARSVPGIDLGSAVIAAKEMGFLEKGGGHAMAAGFEIAVEKLDLMRDFLIERLSDSYRALSALPLLSLEGLLQAEALKPELVLSIRSLGPFGNGNPEPRFALPSMRILKADRVGEGHVRAIMQGSGGGRIKTVAFRVGESDLARALLAPGAAPLHLAGKARINEWLGRQEAEFQIDDAAFSA